MMNPQMAAQHQAAYSNQLPPQPQNVGQQRQTPNGPQKTAQGPQQMPNPYANYDPQLTLWNLEKPRNVEGWDDVEPEKQHVALEDLENELIKFRRNCGSVKRALDEIPTSTCRRLINELVERQTIELWKYNKRIQYTIAGILLGWRWTDRRKTQRQLKRVQVILKTEASGFQEPQVIKPAAGGTGNTHGAQDVKQASKPNGAAPGMQQHQQHQQGYPNTQGPSMAPQAKSNLQQGQPAGQNQQFEQRPPPPPGNHNGQGGHAPPPPPPPVIHQGHGPVNTGAPPPPPPPPSGIHLPQPPHGVHQQQQQQQQHANVMPGTYPGTKPMQGVKMQPGIQIQNPQFLHNGKSKRKGHHEVSSSESDSAWESETTSSSSEPIRVRNVEDGDYGLVGRREGGHSRRSSRSKKSRRHRSQSHGRDRSNSRVRHRSSRRHRDSDSIHPPSIGRHSPISSKGNSPKQPEIHIHMAGSNNSSGDERGQSRGKGHKRHDSFNESPTSFYNKKKLEKVGTSQPMARGSSWESWDRASDIASYATSLNDEGVYDSPRRPRGHDRIHSYSRQHQGSFTPPQRYEDLERHHDARHPFADDYPRNPSPPRGRDPYHHEPGFNSRPPLPHRQNSVQHPSHPTNPFDPTRYPPKIMRSTTYAGDMHERDYPYPQQPRYMQGTSPVEQDRFKIDELAGALLEHIKKDTARAPLRRRHTERRDPGVFNDEDWDHNYPSTTRGRRYDGYGY